VRQPRSNVIRRCSIRKLLIKILSLYRGFSLLLLKVRGRTPEDRAARRIVSGKSWEEFCDTLKAAGAAVSGMNAPMDPLDQAEGYRYLSRLARAGLESFIEYSDPKAPVLRRMVHETAKIGADNPDNHYFNAAISGRYEYRLRGRRGTVHFLELSTQKNNYAGGGGLELTGRLDSTELALKADGTFEVAVSRERRPGNWLPLQEDSGMLILRQTFLDKGAEEPCELTIERVGGDGLPSPVTAESIDRGLASAGKLVAGVSLLFARWASGFRRHTNELPQMDPQRSTDAGGDPEIAYYHSYWRLEPDEALVIEATPPECAYWNFQLNNHWMESLDYRYHRIHVNKHTARYREDGSVRIVVAHEDPGVENWIQTVGHSCGTMCLRWIKADRHPQPRTRVVKINELRATAD